MSTAALVPVLVAALMLPADVPPDPQPADLTSADWVLPLLVGTAVLVVLAVAAVVILRRRRAR